MPHFWKFLVPAQLSLLVCVAVQKKLNFDLLTLSSGSGGRRGGGTREGELYFFQPILDVLRFSGNTAISLRIDHELVENMPNAARIGHELTEIRGDSWWFARFSLTTVIKKVHPCFGGISSKMNDPRMSAVIFVNSWDSGPVWNRGIKQYFLHILSLETDKNPYWISGSWRMNVYPFSWPISR